MPHIGILGTALTTHVTKPYGLFVGGADVIKGNGTVPSYGTPMETITVTENGPGAVSSMSFSVDDPNLVLAVTPGMEVLFYDFTDSYPIFKGFVQGVAIRPDFGDLGRSFDVECIGIECVLDWAMVPVDLTVPVGNGIDDQVRMIVAAAIGLGPINALTNSLISNGNQATPVSGAGMGPTYNTVTVPAGTTVREAIRLVLAGWTPLEGTVPGVYINMDFTVDFYYGLRVYRTDSPPTVEHPDDYLDETVIDVTGGTNNAESLTYATDLGVAHVVYVKGFNAAGSGLVSDGTGQPGPVAMLNDQTIDTAAKKNAAGQAYLTEFASGLRGQYVQTDRADVKTTHPGGMIVVTDARVGLSAQRLRIMAIQKSFHAVLQDWAISFGGTTPSMVNMVRRLTRDVRS